MEKNYCKMDTGKFTDLGDRLMLGQPLGLTGCEISMNHLAAGKFIPFIHAHKQNEEVYLFLSGKGTFYIDGEELPVQEGSLFKVAPAGERAIKAGDEGLAYICIQVQENSLVQATEKDGILSQAKASWME